MHKRESFRVEISGVTDRVFIEPKILMQKNANFALLVAQIRNAHTPQKYIFVARYGIVTNYLQTQLIARQFDIRN